MHRIMLMAAAAAGFLLAGCEDDGAGWKVERDRPAPLTEAQPLRIDAVPLAAEIAISEAEQRQGLMRRERLAPDHGMLFVYRVPQRMTFWMKDTWIPLDIGFFDAEGTLLQVARMYPRDRSTTASASDAVQFALEMEQGWFRSQGLAPGARLDLQMLGEAIAARGEDPAVFGLEPAR